jgi:hypothetical protein
MTVVVTHTTPADSTFSSTGAAAWNADHALSGVGTMAEQNANAVAITGGTINNTTIGATTPSTGVFTTLTAQTEVLKGTGQNLITYSQDFSNAAWTKLNSTVSGTLFTAPDGTTTANKLQVNTTNGQHAIYRFYSSSTNITFTESVYLKAGEITWVLFIDVQANGFYINLSTGALGTLVGSPVNPTITSVGSGWYRVSFTFTNSLVNQGVGIYAASGNGTASFAGANTTDGLYIWGAQLEIGSTANTYIPTTAAAVYGTPTLSFSGVASIGLQSDGSLYETSAGTGNVRFYTNNIGQEQARVSHTASAVNYVNLTGGATATDAQISALGSDTNIWLQLNGKGNRGVAIGYFTRIGRNFANYFEATGNNASSAPILSVGGSDTNIDINLTTKGTGGVLINANGIDTVLVKNSIPTILGSTSTTNLSNKYFVIGSRQYTTTEVGTTLIGSENTSTANNVMIGGYYGELNAASNIQFYTAGNVTTRSGTKQFQVNNTASAVNYVQVTGAATGSTPSISAQGSDSNAGLTIQAKGTAGVNIGNGTYFKALEVTAGGVANYIQIASKATGVAPTISALGTDTNIPLVLQPKGTGALQAQQTDSTATGGNARGANAVDWQTSRDTAAKVASGQLSIVGGGYGNLASGFASVSIGGQANTVSSSYGVVAGYQNTVTGPFSSSLSGQLNTAAGYYNFIGGGFTNSGTANAVVTTQSATMNGTTAVTLSGSNASIKVGQYIAGTSIAADTYVAAISGTSLTLSKVASGSSTSTLSFYTPHGVVVGGGNNQATGSYSYIGGGGDAGNTANRNVASGDWSSVLGGTINRATGKWSTAVGGGGNLASGEGAVVVGGGSYGGGLASNVSGSTSSFVGAGYGNTANGYCSAIVGGSGNVAINNFSFVGGGTGNTANAPAAGISGGYAGTTRGIVGMQTIPACAHPITTTQGITQAGILILARETTDATATRLASDSGAAGTTNQIILPNNSAYYFKGSVIANVTGGGNTKAWAIEGAIKRGANAASTALVGTPTVVSGFADVGAATWDKCLKITTGQLTVCK